MFHDLMSNTRVKYYEDVVHKYDEKWMYFYEYVFKKLIKVKHYLLVGYFVLLFGWLIIAYIIEKYFAITSFVPDWWLYTFIYAIVLSTAFLFLDLAKRRFRRDLPHMLDLMPNKECKVKLFEIVMFIGNPKKQALLCVPFSAFVFLVMVLQQVVQIDLLLKVFVSFCGILVTSTTAVGIWVAVFTFRMTLWISNFEGLKLDFVDPAQTLGVTKLAGLMSFYATLFAINVLVWESSYFYLVYSAPTKLPFWRIDSMSFFIAVGIFVFFFLFLIWYFLHPQLAIISMVKFHKRIFLHGVQVKIKDIYSSKEIQESAAILLDKYLSLYKEIGLSKGSLPIQDFFAFGASFFSSIVVSILGNIQTYSTMFNP